MSSPVSGVDDLLEVADLTVRFGRDGRPAVNGVSFRLVPGQRLGLIGESGSGKSVTALAVMGLLPDAARATGSVSLAGRSMLRLTDRQAARVRGEQAAMVFQEPMTALDPTMRVGRQVAEALLLHRGRSGEARRRVMTMLDEVGLPDPVKIAERYPHQLSGGQRQRVLLAMAMIAEPELLICDEPTTALDVTVQARVLELIDRTLTVHGTACLFISHDLAVVAQVCTDVLVMLDGRIVERGPTTRVLGAPKHPYTRGLVATSRLDLVPVGQRLPTIADFTVPASYD